jgi:hypothetical protein
MRSDLLLTMTLFTSLTAANFNPLSLFKLALKDNKNSGLLKQSSNALDEVNLCYDAFREIMFDDSCDEKAFGDMMFDDNCEEELTMYVSTGMMANDLGIYDYCIEQLNLTYALVHISSLDALDSTDRRGVMFGLCVPQQCETGRGIKEGSSLKFLDNIYKQGLILSGLMKNPGDPIYSFPRREERIIWSRVGLGIYFSLGIFSILLIITVSGYLVGKTSFGEKSQSKSQLVEFVEEDNPE